MLKQKQVMVVEDEGLIAMDIAGQLVKSGYDVVAVSASGEEALAFLETSTPDLVLMDIRLKGKLDGIDTAIKVRSEHDVPVIFLTSHADSETLARAKRAEPFGYLVKPFRQLNLCSAIEMALYKHQSERALLQREAWLTTVLQSTGDPTIVTDVDGRIQFLNASAERLLNVALPDAAGTLWTETVPLFEGLSDTPAEDLVPLTALKMAALKIPRGVILRRRDGGDIDIEGEVSPSVLHGNVAGAVITMRDVSQRNQEESEVRQEQKMLAVGRMAGGIAHDFNNLLTVILGHGTELSSTTRDPQHLARIEAILKAAVTAAGIAQQLLTLSRTQGLPVEMFPVNDRVRRVASIFEASLGPSIQLRTELAEGTGSVRMNAANLDQLLINLLLNSRDAMQTGGEIVIRTSNADGTAARAFEDLTGHSVEISITDTGAGIAPEIQDHIFEPFFTTKGSETGSGLGLAIVYGIVKDACGEITMRSTPGVGTCFRILLPRAEEPASPLTHVQSSAESLVVKTVLLVEDQPAIRALVHNYLEQKGFNLIEAADGQEAIALAEMYDGRIDLLISDVLMPKMDGITLSLHLTALLPDLKVLLISGQPGDAISARRGPGLHSNFLAKPFTLSSLLEKVRELAA